MQTYILKFAKKRAYFIKLYKVLFSSIFCTRMADAGPDFGSSKSALAEKKALLIHQLWKSVQF